MTRVQFPDGEDVLEHLTVTLEIIEEIEKESKDKNEIYLDLSNVHWFIPCSMILISNKIREITDNKVKVSYKPPENNKAKNRMEKIGFPLGGKKDGSSYVSIKHFKKDREKENQINKEVNELIDSVEEKLPYEFGDSIKYILGELSDNVDEHSKFSYASLMAQYFPTKKIVDITIFDNGITIPGSFEKNEIAFNNDVDAIKKAIWEGATTKKEKMRGYGLRKCRKLSIEGLKGELHIVSRKGILIIKSNEEQICNEIEENSLKGTFFYLRLKAPKKKLDIYKYVE